MLTVNQTVAGSSSSGVQKMSKMGSNKQVIQGRYALLLIAVLFSTTRTVVSWNSNQEFNQEKQHEDPSELVKLEYHMGPVLTASPIKLYTIWYGNWKPTQQSIIRDFLLSLSSSSSSSQAFPSVADWWLTVRLYTDQTDANITGNIILSGEYHDLSYSHGDSLSRLTIQSIIKNAAAASSRQPRALPLNPYDGLYLVLTSSDVRVEDFCKAVCGFHYFTFPSIVGMTVPYAWVGYSGTQCPGICAFPFSWTAPNNSDSDSGPHNNDDDNNNNNLLLGAPNGDVGADGMISVIAHELAEASSDPLANAWYAGNDPTAPTEIADLCIGVYGSGGGGGYPGQVYTDSLGKGFNVNGINGRRFLVQWVWNPVSRRCFGPNAVD